jgi:hypothetical protein
MLGKGKVGEAETVNLAEFIEVKGWKAIGNKLCGGTIKEVKMIETAHDDDEQAINFDIDFEITKSERQRQTRTRTRRVVLK